MSARGPYNKNYTEDKIPTKREIECVEMASQGLTRKEIAFKLGLEVKTINAHFYTFSKKFNTHNTAHGFRKLVELGYLRIKVSNVPDQVVLHEIDKLFPAIYQQVKEALLNGTNSANRPGI